MFPTWRRRFSLIQQNVFHLLACRRLSRLGGDFFNRCYSKWCKFADDYSYYSNIGSMGAYFTDVLLSRISFYRMDNITLSAHCPGRCIDVFYRGDFIF